MTGPYVHNKTNYTLDVKFFSRDGQRLRFYTLSPGQKMSVPVGRWYISARRFSTLEYPWRPVTETGKLFFLTKKPKKKKKKIRKKPKAKRKTKRNPCKRAKVKRRKKKKAKTHKKAKVKRRKKTKKNKKAKKAR